MKRQDHGRLAVPAVTAALDWLQKRHTAVLMFAVIQALQQRIERSFPHMHRIAGYAAFGVDGARIDVPRTSPPRGPQENVSPAHLAHRAVASGNRFAMVLESRN